MNAVFWVWLCIFLWRIFGSLMGSLTRKEKLCLDVQLDCIAVLWSVFLAITADHWWSHLIWALLFVQNIRITRKDYRAWKNADDDDDFRHRRREKVKSWLPKPITRSIPQPV